MSGKTSPEEMKVTADTNTIWEAIDKVTTYASWRFYRALKDSTLKFFTVGPGKYPMKVVKGQDIINLITKWETNVYCLPSWLQRWTREGVRDY